MIIIITIVVIVTMYCLFIPTWSTMTKQHLCWRNPKKNPHPPPSMTEEVARRHCGHSWKTSGSLRCISCGSIGRRLKSDCEGGDHQRQGLNGVNHWTWRCNQKCGFSHLLTPEMGIVIAITHIYYEIPPKKLDHWMNRSNTKPFYGM
jgi:hypothetical protein